MSLYERHGHPDLDEPVLVLALEGWIDAGHAAVTAGKTLLEQLDTYPVATFDTDVLFDHRARRPILHLVDGVNTSLTWPTLELRGATDHQGQDLLILVGAEPDHVWRAFTASVVGLAQDLGTRLVVGLGAYPATVPHTRSVPMSITASTPELASVSGLLRGTLEVPAGVQAAIERACGDHELPAVGLWAQIPHYVSGDGNPYHAGSLALLRQLERTADLALPTSQLADLAETTRQRLDAAVAANPEHLALLRSLEQSFDEFTAEAVGPPEVPDADELVEEVERFLRNQPPAD